MTLSSRITADILFSGRNRKRKFHAPLCCVADVMVREYREVTDDSERKQKSRPCQERDLGSVYLFSHVQAFVLRLEA